MEPNKQLDGPSGAPTGQPSRKAQLFIRLLLSGKPTVDAHRLAGYKGEPHAAYELRAKLKDAISAQAEAMGVSLDGLKAAAASLLELPVEQTSVNVRERLAILAEARKVVELGSGPKGRTVNALIIERPPKGPVMETSIVKEPEAQPVGRDDDSPVGGVGQEEVAPELSRLDEEGGAER